MAQETDAQKAKGKSAAVAEEIATRIVVRQTIQAEKDRRTQEVAPLIAALGSLDRPRGGCWAYIVTTTTRRSDSTTVAIEQFDPFQPEERLWTLVSFNGQAPGEKSQANYRAQRLRAWKKQQRQSPPKYSAGKSAGLSALFGEIDLDRSAPDGSAIFTFLRGHTHIAPLGDIPSRRETYRIDAAGRNVLQHTQVNLEPGSMLGGSIKLHAYASTTDYTLLEPALPPFIAKSVVRYHDSFFGKDTGDVEVENVYSDYHRVKCYDDRFEVRIGEPSLSDFLPAN